MNCLLTGVGGQGTLLASKLIARAAMQKGEKVRSAETIGMAQRGGSVVSHVRVGESLSPMIPLGQADVLIGFEPAEAVRCLPYLKRGGVAVVCVQAIRPVTASLSGSRYDGNEMLAFLRERVEGAVLIDGAAVCRQVGSPRALNMALLGAAAQTGALGLGLAELEEALRLSVRPQFVEMNQKALRLGAECVREK